MKVRYLGLGVLLAVLVFYLLPIEPTGMIPTYGYNRFAVGESFDPYYFNSVIHA